MIFSSFYFLNQSWAGTVRTVYSDGVIMLPIYLRMGQSTVLRFTEKPKKVVLGNSNYYSVEFIDNDLALQPLGVVMTNFFVYGQKNVYGFILKTNQGANYDDLVQVDLKENRQSTKVEKQKPVLKEISRPKLGLDFGKNLKVTLSRVQIFQGSNASVSPYVLDFLIENTSKNEIDLKKLGFAIWRGKIKLSPQEVIFRDDKLKPNEMTASRIFVGIGKKADFTLQLHFKNQVVRKAISGRFL